MSKLNKHFGSAINFSDNTWPKIFSVSAGDFVILPKDKYERLITALKGIKNSMNVHPNCIEDSER